MNYRGVYFEINSSINSGRLKFQGLSALSDLIKRNAGIKFGRVSHFSYIGLISAVVTYDLWDGGKYKKEHDVNWYNLYLENLSYILQVAMPFPFGSNYLSTFELYPPL